MCAKVSEIRSAKGKSAWNNYYATYENTRADVGDLITATRFNSFRYNIGSEYSTDIPEVDDTSVIKGSYFLTVMEKANEWLSS